MEGEYNDIIYRVCIILFRPKLGPQGATVEGGGADICDNRLYSSRWRRKEMLPGASYAPPYPGQKGYCLLC